MTSKVTCQGLMLRRVVKHANKSLAFGAALGAMLLAAQVFAFHHDLDPESYSPDHACEICLSASVFGGAIAASPAHFEALTPDRSTDGITDAPFFSRVTRHAPVRAPPVTS